MVARLQRSPWILALPAAVVVAAPLFAVIGTPWHLTGDFAHTEMLVRAVPSHPPLIGVAARVRDNGATPGPSMAYLLAPVYRLLGGGAWALAAAVAVAHVAALVAVAVVAHRIAGLRAATALSLGLLVAVVAVGPGFYLEPWNVWVPLFAFVLLVVLVWGVNAGHDGMILPAVLVGSHCVQTHVGYTVLVLGLLSVAAGVVASRIWRDRLHRRRRVTWLAAAVLGLVVAWIPPVVEQFQPGTGNLRKVVSQFLDPGQPAVGILAGLRASAARLNLIGMWRASTAGDARADLSIVGALAFVGIVVPGAVLLVRTAERRSRAWLTVLGLTTALGVLSATRVFGTFFEYVVRWMVPLAALWLGTAGWGYRDTIARRSATPSRRRVAEFAVVLVAALALTVAGVARASGVEIPHRRDSDLTAALSAGLRDDLRISLARGDRYQLNEVDIAALGSVAFGLVLDIERHDGGVGIGPWGRSGTMSYRVVEQEDASGTLWLVTSQRMIDHFAAQSGARVVTTVDVRTAAERVRSERLEADVLAALCAAGRSDLVPFLAARWGYTVLVLDDTLPEVVTDMVAELIELRQVAAIVQLPTGVDGFAIRVPPPSCPD